MKNILCQYFVREWKAFFMVTYTSYFSPLKPLNMHAHTYHRALWRPISSEPRPKTSPFHAQGEPVSKDNLRRVEAFCGFGTASLRPRYTKPWMAPSKSAGIYESKGFRFFRDVQGKKASNQGVNNQFKETRDWNKNLIEYKNITRT